MANSRVAPLAEKMNALLLVMCGRRARIFYLLVETEKVETNFFFGFFL
jgi:hypothetical protein